MRKNLRLNSGNEIGRSVERSLDEYFRKLSAAWSEALRSAFAKIEEFKL